MGPLITQASVPPTIALSTSPKRIICNPRPIACVAEEQALQIEKVGPRTEKRMPSVVGAALGMSFGIDSGSMRLDSR